MPSQPTRSAPTGGAPPLPAPSPEFAMKKLMAAGETRIHAFAHVWRNRERGALHSPEFTMLEWYRAGQDYAVLMDDCMAFLRLAAQTAGSPLLRFRDRTCDPFAAPERLSVAEAFQRHAGIDLLATMDATATPMRRRWRRRCARRVSGPPPTIPGPTCSRVCWSRRWSPISGWAASPSSTVIPQPRRRSPRRTPDDPRTAERFELYACGVELANGFGELTNAAEQRRRFGLEMDEKQRVYGERYPLDEDFLAALALMPPASGIALGFDRLVMLATAAPRIDDVIWAPVPDAG